MLDELPGRSVWLIDRREYWREPFAKALRQAGFVVAETGGYINSLEFENGTDPPDLAVLACTAVTVAELKLVRSLACNGLQVLALVATLPPGAMRQLFLAGAFDVVEMPVHREEFVTLVAGTLKDVMSSHEHKAVALAGL